MVSAAPPAANGTISRTGFTGHSAALAVAASDAMSAASIGAALYMRPLLSLMQDVEQASHIGCAHRRGDVLEFQCLPERPVEAFDFGELQRLLRIEFVARALRQRARHLGDLGVIVDGARVGIGPVDRAREHPDEAREGVALLLERIG